MNRTFAKIEKKALFQLLLDKEMDVSELIKAIGANSTSFMRGLHRGQNMQLGTALAISEALGVDMDTIFIKVREGE